MKAKANMIRGYHHYSRCWYSEVLPEDDYITIGIYDSEGCGMIGEFTVTWHLVTQQPFPRLEAYDDSWSTLIQFSDVLEKMAEVNDKNITPLEFCKLLESCGVVDLTEETNDKE